MKVFAEKLGEAQNEAKESMESQPRSSRRSLVSLERGFTNT